MGNGKFQPNETKWCPVESVDIHIKQNGLIIYKETNKTNIQSINQSNNNKQTETNTTTNTHLSTLNRL